MIRRPPRSALFPYPALFGSREGARGFALADVFGGVFLRGLSGVGAVVQVAGGIRPEPADDVYEERTAVARSHPGPVVDLVLDGPFAEGFPAAAGERRRAVFA